MNNSSLSESKSTHKIETSSNNNNNQIQTNQKIVEESYLLKELLKESLN